jgi:hypothetical protein
MEKNFESGTVIVYPFSGVERRPDGDSIETGMPAGDTLGIRRVMMKRILDLRHRQCLGGLTPGHDDGLASYDLMAVMEGHIESLRDGVERSDPDQVLNDLIEVAATAMRFIEWTLRPEFEEKQTRQT